MRSWRFPTWRSPPAALTLAAAPEPEVVLLHEPPDGGVAENVLQLARGLADHGWTPVVAGPAASSISDGVRDAGVTHIVVPGLARGYRRPDRDLRAIGEVRALLRSRRPALLHCHASKAGLIGRLAAGGTTTPVVYTPHCYGFVGDVPRARRVFATTLELGLRPLTAAVLCVCEDERRMAVGRRLIAERRSALVYNGVEDCPPSLPGEVDPELGRWAAGSGPVFGAVSALREQKRLDVLLRAIPRVLAAVPEARAVIVGNGSLQASLERQARELGLAPDQRFAMLPFRRPSSRFLHGLDVFVLPSAWEALPIGVLEALACGVPQVATAVGGTPEAVSSETGILVPVGDERALAEALITLLRDPARRAGAAAASRARHAERFGIARMVRETAAVYDRAAQRAA